MRHHFKKTVHGFSLIETVVVVGLMVLVGGALSTMIQYFYRTNAYVLQEGTAVQNARVGLATAIQNLREASYGDDGSYPIATAATSSVTFYADINGDGKVDKIGYSVIKNTVYRTIVSSTGNPPSYAGQPVSTSTIATYLRNATSSPVFQYNDSSGALLVSPINISNIATVSVNLQIDVDPNRSPAVYTLLGSATLRNLEN